MSERCGESATHRHETPPERLFCPRGRCEDVSSPRVMARSRDEMIEILSVVFARAAHAADCRPSGHSLGRQPGDAKYAKPLGDRSGPARGSPLWCRAARDDGRFLPRGRVQLSVRQPHYLPPRDVSAGRLTSLWLDRTRPCGRVRVDTGQYQISSTRIRWVMTGTVALRTTLSAVPPRMFPSLPR